MTANAAATDLPLPNRTHLLQAGLSLSAMLLFCASDVFAKLLSSVPPLELAWLRYLGGMFVIVPLVIRRPALLRSGAPRAQFTRSVALLAATFFLISALHLMPIAEATTLVFLSPIFVSLLSAVMLRETVGLARFLCLAAGLAGVVIVARPDVRGLQYAALLPICSALSWATGTALTRVTQRAGDTALMTLAWSAIIGFAILCLLVPALFEPLSWRQALLASAMSLVWTAGHVAVIGAYRLGRIAAVAPFSYSQIVWSVLFGWLVFQDLPDLFTLLGCVVIVASGIVAAGLLARESETKVRCRLEDRSLPASKDAHRDPSMLAQVRYRGE